MPALKEYPESQMGVRKKSEIRRDTFGEYRILTGHEGTGKCWWCGAAFPDKRRRYCSVSCRREYEENFYWLWASTSAVRRARYRCRECGIRGKRRLEVHHIVPLNGSDRIINVLNRRENLVVLCKACHRKKHLETKYISGA